jgi:NTE family protein
MSIATLPDIEPARVQQLRAREDPTLEGGSIFRGGRESWWARRRRDRGPVAFVLGGGGNLGAVQIGMLRALAEHGIAADLVVGCSVGAMNAAGYAADPTVAGIARMEAEWRSIRGDDIFPHGRVWGPWQLAMRRQALHAPSGLQALIERFLPYRRIEDAAVRLSVVATSLEREDEAWFERGDAIDALMASTALPGLLPPVAVDGQLFVDGGVVNQVPLNRAVQRGARRIYVLTCGRPLVTPKRPIDMVLNSFAISRGSRLWRDLAILPDGVEAVVLPVSVDGPSRYTDFTRTGELIDRAYAQASRFLASMDVSPAIATV